MTNFHLVTNASPHAHETNLLHHSILRINRWRQCLGVGRCMVAGVEGVVHTWGSGSSVWTRTHRRSCRIVNCMHAWCWVSAELSFTLSVKTLETAWRLVSLKQSTLWYRLGEWNNHNCMHWCCAVFLYQRDSFKFINLHICPSSFVKVCRYYLHHHVLKTTCPWGSNELTSNSRSCCIEPSIKQNSSIREFPISITRYD